MKLKLSPDGIEAGSTMTAGDGSAAETGAAVGDKKPKRGDKKPKRAAKPKAAKTPTKSKPTPQELPNLKGPGVAPVKIPKLDRLAKKYSELDDDIDLLKSKKDSVSQELFIEIHAHEKVIGRNGAGEIIYRFEDRVLKVTPGKEKLTIQNAAEAGVPDED